MCSASPGDCAEAEQDEGDGGAGRKDPPRERPTPAGCGAQNRKVAKVSTTVAGRCSDTPAATTLRTSSASTWSSRVSEGASPKRIGYLESQPNGRCSVDGVATTFGCMNETSIPDAFLTALSVRDFSRLAECLRPSAQARMLLPRGPEVRSGRDEIARRIEGWFAAGSDFTVLETGHEMVGRRHRLSWRFRMSRGDQGPETVEQVAFMDVAPDGISQIDLLCSGFLLDGAMTTIPSLSCAV